MNFPTNSNSPWKEQMFILKPLTFKIERAYMDFFYAWICNTVTEITKPLFLFYLTKINETMSVVCICIVLKSVG